MALPEEKAEETTTITEDAPVEITTNNVIKVETTQVNQTPIKKATSKILEPKYDKVKHCDFDECPIKTKEILMGMHAVFYEEKESLFPAW